MHSLKLTHAGYEDQTVQVEVKENNLTEANIEMSLLPQHPNEQEFTVNGVKFKMIKVEAGTFQMGSTSGDSDEKPVHSVTLTHDYYMGETEVTQELWQAVMGNNPSNFKGSNLPVETVSYQDVEKFLTKLNKLTGKNFRFPTEAEWEYAAKGGNKSQGYTYAGSNTIGDVAWYWDNSDRKTHPVAQKQPNELGLYDMSGNVWEWCYDWKGSYPSGAQTDPTGASSGSSRVGRGGSWNLDAAGCRAANRDSSTPSYRYDNLGFRLAL
ncbi:MAG: SUMF1/EgtB/PvdO family nonheme iron enzyme [Bacteroidales bacterium]|nr:SUMF1/EgtB/PvdO family nonheme iron enzyme [Bacteroidales bacterium]